LKFADLRRCTLQLAFEFVDPLCPLPGRLDQGLILDLQHGTASAE
jgi:hypothetical protein